MVATTVDDELTGLGLRRVRCDATPPHRAWVVDDGQYPPGCPWCRLDAVIEAGRVVCRHGVWRRWRITRRALLWLYQRGWVTGPGVRKIGEGCDGCLIGIRIPGEGDGDG